jgi:hypothetical protein
MAGILSTPILFEGIDETKAKDLQYGLEMAGPAMRRVGYKIYVSLNRILIWQTHLCRRHPYTWKKSHGKCDENLSEPPKSVKAH